MSESSKQKVRFSLLFIVIGLISLQLPLLHIAGSKASFTAFDAFGPLAGVFLGAWPGVLSVFLMQGVNLLIHGLHSIDKGSIIHLIPALFAVMYFARKSKLNWIIPLAAILAFNLNPLGRSVWFFSLFWLVPVVCYFFYNKSLLAKSLGATFTAHAVGGAIWIWTFNLSKATWIGLIPIVIVERLVFAAGIAVFYLALKAVFESLAKRYSSLAWLAPQPANFLDAKKV